MCRWSCRIGKQRGVGNRSSLETAETQPESIALATELELTRSVNMEVFLGRIAEVCRAEGDDSLYRALVAGRGRPSVELIGFKPL